MVRTLRRRLPAAVVVVPVRAKEVGGAFRTGEERFAATFGRSAGTEFHDGPGLCPTPDVVVLNAFDVAWHTDVQKTLIENVAPMLAYLDACVALPTPPKVVVVSSAYVQPPAPHAPLSGLMPMGCGLEAGLWYDGLVDGSLDWESLQSDVAGCHAHTLTNSYIFAKTLMEHLVIQRYGDRLPIAVVRPSNIGPSCDGEHGVTGTFGPQLFASICQTPYFRFWIEGGGVDVVPVCGVADVVVDAALALDGVGSTFHHATCGGAEAVRVAEFLAGVSSANRWCLPPALGPLCRVAQRCEGLVAGTQSAKKRKLVDTVYENYNYWAGNRWQFPAHVSAYKEQMLATLRLGNKAV